MMTTSCLRIQCDWEASLATRSSDTAWITFAQVGANAVHGTLTFQSNESGDINCQASNGFSCEIVDRKEKRIKVGFKSDTIEYSCIIQAPSATLKTDTSILSVGISPQSELGVFSSVEGGLSMWSVRENAIRRTYRGHVGDVYTCKFFPSGQVIASGGADYRVKIWDALEEECAATLVGHAAGVQGIDFIDRGRNIVSCSRDRTSKLWDVPSQTVIRSFPADSALNDIVVTSSGLSSTGIVADAREFNTDGKVVVVACESGSIRGYDIRQSDPEIFSMNCGSSVNSVSVSESQLIGGTQSGEVQVWDARKVSTDAISKWRLTSSPCTKVSAIEGNRVAVSHADGLVYYCVDSVVRFYLSGSDFDPINSVALARSNSSNVVFTGSRDCQVRSYRFQ